MIAIVAMGQGKKAGSEELGKICLVDVVLPNSSNIRVLPASVKNFCGGAT
jgi:hypothetical protein